MKINAKTDVGKCRANNQDAFLIRHIGNYTLGLVCDGMGGASGGNVASALAAETFAAVISEKLPDAIHQKDAAFPAMLEEALNAANTAVYEKAKGDPSLSGMGTTLCAVLTDGKRIGGVSVGDSRMYYFTEDDIVQLSHDHSFVQVLIDSGSITKEQARTHPNRNIITRAIGTSPAVEGDYFDMAFPGKAMLLCSDGLTNYVEDNELLRMFRETKGLSALIDAYIDAANEGGGGDNITALVMLAEND